MFTHIMQGTQISLTMDERRALDGEAARTGRSISALIRDGVEIVYGTKRSSDDDLAGMRQAFGSWTGRESDGASWVDAPPGAFANPNSDAGRRCRSAARSDSWAKCASRCLGTYRCRPGRLG